MKKLALAISVIMILALCSCNYALMSISNRGDDYITHKFSYFGGEKQFPIVVDEDTVFTIESTVKSGEINVTVENDEKEQIFQGNLFTETQSFNAEKNKYLITINADNASGEYKIMWKPQ